MANAYVDFSGGGSATSPFDTWAKATSSLQNGLTQAGAGGRCFVKTDGAGTSKDTASGNRTLTSPGTATNPTLLIGCKSGTTNEGDGIVAADLVTRGDVDVPAFQTTTNGYLDLRGVCFAAGIELDIDGFVRQDFANNSHWICQNSEILWDYITMGGIQTCSFEARDCEITIRSTNHQFRGNRGCWFRFTDCLFTFSSNPSIFANTASGRLEMIGCNLTGLGNNTLARVDNNPSYRFANCRLPASYIRTVKPSFAFAAGAELIIAGCTNDGALGGADSVLQFYRADGFGEVQEETTKVRTGGASDGVAGAFSWKLLTWSNQAFEGSRGIFCPWIKRWVNGDGTNQTFRLHIANDGAGDLLEDEAFCQWLIPDPEGTAQHKLIRTPDKRTIGLTAAITDDTGSTWGGSVGNHQKFEMTADPACSGWMYARVGVCKKQATPDAVYVDPRIAIEAA